MDVVAVSYSNNIFVMLGNGNGSLGNPITSAITINPSGYTTSLAVADLNADGNPDAIVTNSQGYGGDHSLTVLSGSGNGSFNSPTNYPFSSDIYSSLYFDPRSVVAGDLDFDNDVDVVVSGQGYGSAPDRAVVLLNNGSGSLTELDTANLPYGPDSSVLSDLDGDDDLDLVVANQYSNTVAPRFNNSDLTGGGPGKRSYTYDPIFNQVASETDELGRQTLYAIDPLTGNRIKMTQVVGAVGGTDDVITNYTYTNKNLIDTETDPNGRVTDYDYNPQDQLVKITVAKGTVDEAVQQFEYDAAGNQSAVIDENNIRTEYEYDAMNLLKKTTFAKGTPDEATQEFEYDGDGNQTAVIDEKGNRSEFEYNMMNQLVKVTATDPDGSGPLSSPVTSYEYDKNGGSPA